MIELGKFLQEKRLSKSLSLENISQQLKIKKEFILAIEQGKEDFFPSKTYYYGYLKQYLKLLKVDNVNLNTEKIAKEQAMSITVPLAENYNLNFLFMIFILLLTIFIYNFYSDLATKDLTTPIALELTKKTSQFVQLQ